MATRLPSISIPWRAPTGVPTRLALLTTCAVVVAGAIVAFRVVSSASSAPGAIVPVPESPAIEEQAGIRITQLTVDADGGLLDLRFQVLDPNKALPLAEDPDKRPKLIAEDDGTAIDRAALMPAKHDLAVGRTYFILYGNVRGAVKHGRPVTVIVGDVRLEHVIAQ